MSSNESSSLRRRDVLQLGSLGVRTGGFIACLSPLGASLTASPLVPGSATVDLTKIPPGSGIRLGVRTKPVFVRCLTSNEIKAADGVPDRMLRDPATLADRTKAGHKNLLVTYAVCTHLGCMPLGITAAENRGSYGGYFCPCHGSEYDTAGRIRSGPAPSNLEIPEYHFLSAGVIQIDG